MVVNQSKVSEESKAEIIERYLLGEKIMPLAKEFGVSASTVQKYIKKAGATRVTKESERSTPATSMREFAKRARSILWRDNQKDYKKWENRVDELKKGGGMTQHQAIVQASKDFPCLKKLFREYAVAEYDPHPESHPDIHYHGQPCPMDGIECEGKEMSHRENLAWAISTAGEFLRTEKYPELCPNDAAFYLFRQAIDEPKDFLGKFTQIEARGDGELDEQRRARRSGQRSIEEIEEMLNTLAPGGE